MTSKLIHTGTPYLYLINGNFYYRRQISGTIRRHLGLREVRRSLRTRNIQTARLRCSYLDMQINCLIKEVIGMLARNIDPTVLKMARHYFETELESYMENIEYAPLFDGPSYNPQYEAEGIPEDIKRYKDMAVTQQFSPYLRNEIAEQFEASDKKLPPQTSDPYIQLGVLLCRAKAEVLRIYTNHLSGDYDQTGRKDPIFLEQKDIKYFSNPDVENLKLSETINRHREQKDEEITLGTKDDYGRIYQWMLEWFGEEVLLIDVSRHMIGTFKDMLSKMPKNYSKDKIYKGLDLKQVIRKSKRASSMNNLSYKTQHKYFSLLKSFFQWTVDVGLLDASPASSIKQPKRKKGDVEKSRLPYSRDDMKTLFHSPLFTGYLSPRHRHKEGEMKNQLAEYWAWLLGFFTGLRIKEIVFLHGRDFRAQDEVLCISVNNDHGKGIKTNSSIRLVPIHEKLIELGLLEWVKKQTKGKANKPIFPMYMSKCEKDLSKTATRKLNPYLRKIGIDDKRKVFHSTRHNFADELRSQNVEIYSIKKLMGHSGGDTTSVYGVGTSIKPLKEAIDKCYSDVDFDHLKLMK